MIKLYYKAREKIMKQYFNSQTYGKCSLEEMMLHISNKIKSDPKAGYLLAVGTDSQNERKDTKFANIVMLHTLGGGGIFFYKVHHEDKIKVVANRMLEEAHQSIELAKEVLKWFEEAYEEGIFDYSLYNINMEIHCDIGYNGASSDAIKGALGWIQAEFGDNILGVIKPGSAAASHIADRYTK